MTSKKNKKDKKRRPVPKSNDQIPNSMIRPLTAPGLNPVLQNARNFPVYGCWIMQDWQSSGMTPVIVARKQDDRRIMFGAYVVDYYCLGIKDAFTRADYSLSRFERELPDKLMGVPMPCSVELAHELIYGALEYAQKLGFEPHPDFYKQKADQMLDPADAHPRTHGLTFGKDGKPLYISGPYDNEYRINEIITTLTRTCGEGNFHYLVGLPDGLVDLDDLDDLPEK